MAANLLPIARDEFTGLVIAGKYELLCRLATGGMSELALAFQRGMAGFQKVVVIKRILEHVSEDSEFVALFLDEARITARFTHPNIVQVFDLDKDGSSPFLAMEFVAGAALHEVLEASTAARQPLPIGLTLAVVRDAALALHYAHTRGDASGRSKQVIHRDVAPKNIMVTFDGTTKLLDFGIAKMAGVSAHTAVGQVRGSVGYMSPEQMFGGALGPATDIFSLGVVLFECLTERPLYEGDSLEDIVRDVLQAPPLPSRVSKKVPASLNPVVLRALAAKPEDRFPTALEFAQAIERAAPGLIWTPDKCGAFMRTLFSGRYEQTCALLDTDSSGSDVTGRFHRLTTSFQALPQPAPEKLRGAFDDDQKTEMVPNKKSAIPVERVGTAPTKAAPLITPALAFDGADGNNNTRFDRPGNFALEGETQLARPPSQSRAAAAAPPPARSPSGSRPVASSPRPPSQGHPAAKAAPQPLQSTAPAPAPSLFYDPVANPFKQAVPQVLVEPRKAASEEDLRPLVGGLGAPVPRSISFGPSAIAPGGIRSSGLDEELLFEGERSQLPEETNAEPAQLHQPPVERAAPLALEIAAPPPAAAASAPKQSWLVWLLAAALVITMALWALDRYRSGAGSEPVPAGSSVEPGTK